MVSRVPVALCCLRMDATLSSNPTTWLRFDTYSDGSTHRLSPERSMEIQALLGSDIQMQLDECLRLPATKVEIAPPRTPVRSAVHAQAPVRRRH